MTLLEVTLKGTRWSEPYLCWHSEFLLFISFSLKGFQIAFSYLAYGDFHLCDRLILLSGIYTDLQYQCTPCAAQDFSQNKHWQRDGMSSEQLFLLFLVPPFLGFAEAGQYNKGCENTNALPRHFLQGWVMMDAGPLKEPSTWGSSVLVRWGYRQPEIPCQQVNSDRQRNRRKALNPAGDLQRGDRYWICKIKSSRTEPAGQGFLLFDSLQWMKHKIACCLCRQQGYLEMSNCSTEDAQEEWRHS